MLTRTYNNVSLQARASLLSLLLPLPLKCKQQSDCGPTFSCGSFSFSVSRSLPRILHVRTVPILEAKNIVSNAASFEFVTSRRIEKERQIERIEKRREKSRCLFFSVGLHRKRPLGGRRQRSGSKATASSREDKRGEEIELNRIRAIETATTKALPRYIAIWAIYDDKARANEWSREQMILVFAHYIRQQKWHLLFGVKFN